VSELGDLLELIYNANRSFETVHGVLRTAHDSDLTEQAMRDFIARDERQGTTHSVFVLGTPEAGPAPGRRVEETRFWHEKPDRWREEITTDHQLGRDGWLAVRDGKRWWSYDPRNGAISNEGDPDVGSGIGDELAALLDPIDLLAAYELTVLGRGEVSGCASIDIRAVDRKTEHHRLHSFPRWGDELRCSIDGERGILLRSATLLDGDEFRSGELSDLVFDQPIPPETFVLEPPEGETFASLGHHEIGPVTLQEAVERASFKMFAIRKLPEGDWRIRVHYAAGTQRPMPESVHMHYMREDAQQQLSLSESPADAAGSGWPEGFNEDAVVRAGIT
jgi:outer membrane lipoprotein-sorting protein